MVDGYGLLIGVLLGAIGTALAAPMAIRMSRRVGLWDRPGGHKAHTRPTPLLGGVAVLAGTGWALLLTAPVSIPLQLAPVAAGLCVIVLAGLIDDFRGMSPVLKLSSQIAAVVVFLAVDAATGHASLLPPETSWPRLIMIVLWCCVLINAFNFLDNMNGLCTGLVAIAAAGLSGLCLLSGSLGGAWLGASLAGASLGFLPYNWPRARVFLGDAGSMSAGFLLAVLALQSLASPATEVSGLRAAAPFMLLALPLLDLAVVAWLRIRTGRRPWQPDRCHLNHRLVARGLSPRVAVLALWTVCAACVLGAYLLVSLPPRAGLVVLLVMLAGLGVVLGWAGARGLQTAPALERRTHPRTASP